MSNLFQKTSSSWVRYDKYEWKEDKEGTLYITPSPDAKVSLYNPLKDLEQMVLKAVNLGLMCMDKNNTQEQLQNAIMDFVTVYGLLGFMTALSTTPDFITYHAVYLPKNHFIKEESMTTEKYLSYFFPFDKIDFVLLFLIFFEFVFVLIVFFIIKILCSVELKSNYNSNYNNCYYVNKQFHGKTSLFIFSCGNAFFLTAVI